MLEMLGIASCRASERNAASPRRSPQGVTLDMGVKACVVVEPLLEHGLEVAIRVHHRGGRAVPILFLRNADILNASLVALSPPHHILVAVVRLGWVKRECAPGLWLESARLASRVCVATFHTGLAQLWPNQVRCVLAVRVPALRLNRTRLHAGQVADIERTVSRLERTVTARRLALVGDQVHSVAKQGAIGALPPRTNNVVLAVCFGDAPRARGTAIRAAASRQASLARRPAPLVIAIKLTASAGAIC
mmetsp:Transcript_8274/g.21056  ORF Transcript_8274/g.21056 Transcript_8274/m.21056 type:complete len:248 (-) Transcript_8274:289-1032(-)